MRRAARRTVVPIHVPDARELGLETFTLLHQALVDLAAEAQQSFDIETLQIIAFHFCTPERYSGLQHPITKETEKIDCGG
jgi:hypothetical protein